MTDRAAPWGVRVRAPGKINLFLGVGAIRDDGYHELTNVFQAVSLYEEVRARTAADISVRFSGPIDTEGVPLDDTNLAVRAARLLAKKTGHDGGVRLEIVKNVPVAGGMGGGSADAAATLVACDALWGTGLGREELMALAGRLGADVPFALAGGTALGTGRGDALSPVLAQGTFDWVLVLSDAGISTPEIFRELDRHRDRHVDDWVPPVHPSVSPELLQALRAGDAALLAECLNNDLQPAALHREPSLAGILEWGETNGALAGIVSGSGPTVAFLTAGHEAALELQVALSASGLRALHVSGPVHGAKVCAD